MILGLLKRGLVTSQFVRLSIFELYKPEFFSPRFFYGSKIEMVPGKETIWSQVTGDYYKILDVEGLLHEAN